MAIGLLDLSAVTDELIRRLRACVQDSLLWDQTPRFGIEVSGLPPDALTMRDGCQLSLYLFHVTPDRFQRNAPVTGPFSPTGATRVPPLPAQPLSLDLYYLLTAYSAGDYVQEQRAMSIALKCLYESAQVDFPANGDGAAAKFFLTLEVETVDEIGRFWQATTSPLRLGAIYRVSVIFIRPTLPDPFVLAPPPQRVVPDVYAVAPSAAPVQVFGTVTTVTPLKPGPPPVPLTPAELSPATVAPGQAFFLHGAGFQGAPPDHVYLLAGGAEADVTNTWLNPNVPSTAARYALKVPANPGRVPGVYQLRVGNDRPANDPAAVRSNATPFSLAALVNPANNPILPAPGGGAPYVLPGGAFDAAGGTEVFLGTVALVAAAGAAPAAGEFLVADAQTIEFLPPPLPPGLYPVRVRVNYVEALPARWVRLP